MTRKQSGTKLIVYSFVLMATNLIFSSDGNGLVPSKDDNGLGTEVICTKKEEGEHQNTEVNSHTNVKIISFLNYVESHFIQSLYDY